MTTTLKVQERFAREAKNPKAWIGWHWLQETRSLRHKSHVVVQAGQTLKASGPLILCSNGLHASKLALDALWYAPGPIICRVRLSGRILEGDNKACASARTCLWWADATRTLHEFACWCATQALESERAAGRVPHESCWEAIRTKMRWLRAESTDGELRLARSTARSAAWSAARSTAESAQKKCLEEMLFALAPEEK